MRSKPLIQGVLLRILIGMLLVAAGLSAQESGDGAKSAEASKAEESREDSRMIWKWANFAILAVALGYAFAKHAPPAFRARTTEIQKGIAEAQQTKRDAEKRAAEMDARMNRLGADIEAFRTQAKADMDREGERLRRETLVQIERIRQQATLEIETAGKTARRELREYAADLALDLAGQRIAARMNPAAEATLVDAFVKDLEREGPQGLRSQIQGSNN